MINLISIGLISENYLLNLVFLIVGWFYIFNKSFSQSWLHGKYIVFQIYACHGLLILLFYDLLPCITVAYMIQQPSHMDMDSHGTILCERGIGSNCYTRYCLLFSVWHTFKDTISCSQLAILFPFVC